MSVTWLEPPAGFGNVSLVTFFVSSSLNKDSLNVGSRNVAMVSSGRLMSMVLPSINCFVTAVNNCSFRVWMPESFYLLPRYKERVYKVGMMTEIRLLSSLQTPRTVLERVKI